MSIGSGKKSELLVYPKTFDAEPLNQYDVIRVVPSMLQKKEYNGRSNWYLFGYEMEMC